MREESNARSANGVRDYGFLSQRMRGVGEITQETEGPGNIIGQVSSLGGGEVRREKKMLPGSREGIINILCNRLEPDYILL